MEWDDLEIDGDLAARDCLLRFKHEGNVRAVATISRDLESLQAEAAMERESTTRPKFDDGNQPVKA